MVVGEGRSQILRLQGDRLGKGKCDRHAGQRPEARVERLEKEMIVRHGDDGTERLSLRQNGGVRLWRGRQTHGRNGGRADKRLDRHPRFPRPIAEGESPDLPRFAANSADSQLKTVGNACQVPVRRVPSSGCGAAEGARPIWEEDF